MLSTVFEVLGEPAELLSPSGEKTGTPLARVSLLKNNARVLYNDKIFETGSFSNDTFVYIGSCENGGDTLVPDGFVLYRGARFLVLRCEVVSVKDFAVMWAVLKKLPHKEEQR